MKWLKLNFYIGLGGPVTFTNAKDPKIVAEKIDINYLLTETDSPYLTPHPYRGKENGPKYIPLIVQKICEIKQISSDEFADKILENTKRLFKIKGWENND